MEVLVSSIPTEKRKKDSLSVLGLISLTKSTTKKIIIELEQAITVSMRILNPLMRQPV